MSTSNSPSNLSNNSPSSPTTSNASSDHVDSNNVLSGDFEPVAIFRHTARNVLKAVKKWEESTRGISYAKMGFFIFPSLLFTQNYGFFCSHN